MKLNLKKIYEKSSNKVCEEILDGFIERLEKGVKKITVLDSVIDAITFDKWLFKKHRSLINNLKTTDHEKGLVVEYIEQPNLTPEILKKTLEINQNKECKNIFHDFWLSFQNGSYEEIYNSSIAENIFKDWLIINHPLIIDCLEVNQKDNTLTIRYNKI